jgi:hydroxyacylglutathione hydrolase
MIIHQFEDKYLSHFSYALLEGNEVVLIDPSRNPQPYYDFAAQYSAKIIAVIETHLHADFVSGHVEIANTTGAKIYIHPAAQPEFSFNPLDDHAKDIPLGDYSLHAIHTPGHSPDSICVLLKDGNQKVTSVFTGDTLFIGDVGRPDLRETTFTQEATRESLARQMFHSLHGKLMKLDDEVLVYPAHGSGSLCGRNMSSQTSSTIGAERLSNAAMLPSDESSFVDMLLKDQPMVPKYFTQSVAANRKKDIAPFQQALKAVNIEVNAIRSKDRLIIDTRSADSFKQSHLKNAINIPGDNKFETWLGTIVSPEENFLLFGENATDQTNLAERAVKIGYEKNLKGLLVQEGKELLQSNSLDFQTFAEHQDHYTIVDVRNESEREAQPVFENSIHIPLHQLRERALEIPTDKSIVTHCGGGNRGAIAASILEANSLSVFDLGNHVKKIVADKKHTEL